MVSVFFESLTLIPLVGRQFTEISTVVSAKFFRGRSEKTQVLSKTQNQRKKLCRAGLSDLKMETIEDFLKWYNNQDTHQTLEVILKNEKVLPCKKR